MQQRKLSSQPSTTSQHKKPSLKKNKSKLDNHLEKQRKNSSLIPDQPKVNQIYAFFFLCVFMCYVTYVLYKIFDIP